MEGTTVLHYEILELLGRGAMGVVYKARDVKLDTFRAIKFIPPGMSELPEAQDRLLREAQAQAKLFHPNIATLIELQITDRFTFIVMEYIDGPTLEDLIQNTELTTTERFNLILQVASAVAAAHSRGILHRDIKPRNVIVSSDGVAKVTDFGLAKALGETTISVTGSVQGTAHYMAPEIFRGERADEATDVWSLGILVYETLVGSPPFQGESFEAIGYQIINNEHPKLGADIHEELPGIEDFIEKCLRKYSDQRIPNGAAALSILEDVASDTGIRYSAQSAEALNYLRRVRSKTLTRLISRISLITISVFTVLLLATQSALFREAPIILPNMQNLMSISWNSTGQQLALIAELGENDLGIVNTALSSIPPSPVSLGPVGQLHEVSWSPTARLLAVSSITGLYLYNLVSSEVIRVLSEPVEDISWSSDGRWIVCLTEERGCSGLLKIGPISLEDVSQDNSIQSKPIIIKDLDGVLDVLTLYHPTFIRGDSSIAFVALHAAENFGLWEVFSDDGIIENIIEGNECPWLIDWDSLNSRLLYTKMEEPGLFEIPLNNEDRQVSSIIKSSRRWGTLAVFDYNESSNRGSSD